MFYNLEDLPKRSTTRSIKRIVPFFKQKNISTILDYGSGSLRNTNYLIKKGFQVTIVDKKDQLNKVINKPEINYVKKLFSEDDFNILNENFDAIISNFVLGLLNKDEREKMFFIIINILKPKGYLLIEIKKEKDPSIYLDKEQIFLDNLVIPLGFNRISTLKNQYSISNLYQKIDFIKELR